MFKETDTIETIPALRMLMWSEVPPASMVRYQTPTGVTCVVRWATPDGNGHDAVSVGHGSSSPVWSFEQYPPGGNFDTTVELVVDGLTDDECAAFACGEIPWKGRGISRLGLCLVYAVRARGKATHAGKHATSVQNVLHQAQAIELAALRQEQVERLSKAFVRVGNALGLHGDAPESDVALEQTTSRMVELARQVRPIRRLVAERGAWGFMVEDKVIGGFESPELARLMQRGHEDHMRGEETIAAELFRRLAPPPATDQVPGQVTYTAQAIEALKASSGALSALRWVLRSLDERTLAEPLAISSEAQAHTKLVATVEQARKRMLGYKRTRDVLDQVCATAGATTEEKAIAAVQRMAKHRDRLQRALETLLMAAEKGDGQSIDLEHPELQRRYLGALGKVARLGRERIKLADMLGAHPSDSLINKLEAVLAEREAVARALDGKDPDESETGAMTQARRVRTLTATLAATTQQNAARANVRERLLTYIRIAGERLQALAMLDLPSMDAGESKPTRALSILPDDATSELAPLRQGLQDIEAALGNARKAAADGEAARTRQGQLEQAVERWNRSAARRILDEVADTLGVPRERITDDRAGLVEGARLHAMWVREMRTALTAYAPDVELLLDSEKPATIRQAVEIAMASISGLPPSTEYLQRLHSALNSAGAAVGFASPELEAWSAGRFIGNLPEITERLAAAAHVFAQRAIDHERGQWTTLRVDELHDLRARNRALVAVVQQLRRIGMAVRKDVANLSIQTAEPVANSIAEAVCEFVHEASSAGQILAGVRRLVSPEHGGAGRCEPSQAETESR